MRSAVTVTPRSRHTAAGVSYSTPTIKTPLIKSDGRARGEEGRANAHCREHQSGRKGESIHKAAMISLSRRLTDRALM
jgi:hypothetical protein